MNVLSEVTYGVLEEMTGGFIADGVLKRTSPKDPNKLSICEDSTEKVLEALDGIFRKVTEKYYQRSDRPDHDIHGRYLMRILLWKWADPEERGPYGAFIRHEVHVSLQGAINVEEMDNALLNEGRELLVEAGIPTSVDSPRFILVEDAGEAWQLRHMISRFEVDIEVTFCPVKSLTQYTEAVLRAKDNRSVLIVLKADGERHQEMIEDMISESLEETLPPELFQRVELDVSVGYIDALSAILNFIPR